MFHIKTLELVHWDFWRRFALPLDAQIITIVGPNGSGKTTLLMTLMGFGGYEVTGGKIIFKGVDITHMPTYERARLGIGMSFQRPPTIHGLKTRHLVSMCARGREVDVDAMAKTVNFDTFLDRDINSGFSGGEIKRSELLQLMAQNPSLILFDEPESGVDLENMALIGNTARALLDGRQDAGRRRPGARLRCGALARRRLQRSLTCPAKRPSKPTS